MDLTAGTSIPPPQQTPPPLSPAVSMAPLIRPPTAGGGPLSSHPTTPIDLPGAWISTPDLLSHERGTSTSPPSYFDPTPSASPVIPNLAYLKQESFRRPLSPASANMQSQTPPLQSQRRDSKGVRKLLSLSSLRNSFASSRSSLMMSSSQSIERPASRSTDSSRDQPTVQGVKRSASPVAAASSTSPIDEQQATAPPLRKHKSQGWFRRRSSLFLFGEDGTMLDSVTEAQSRPGTTCGVASTYTAPVYTAPRSTPRSISNPIISAPIYRPVSTYTLDPAPYEKRSDSVVPPETDYMYRYSRILSPPPTLPEIESLNGGRLDGGSLHTEELFAGIGQ